MAGEVEATGRQSLWVRVAGATARTRLDVALVVLDLVLLSSAYTVTLLLRFDGSVPDSHWAAFGRFLPVALTVAVLSNAVWGLYGQVWRHASAQEARRLLGAGATTIFVLLVVDLGIARVAPISVLLLGSGLGMFLCGGVRFQSRLFSFRRHADVLGLRVAVIGARDAGAALVGEMLRSPQLGFRPVAFLDPDPSLHGRSIMGLRVEGGVEELSRLAETLDVHQAVLAMSSVSSETVREVAGAAEAAGVALKIAPDMVRRMGSGATLQDIREVRIDDLIGRKEVVTDLGSVCAALAGRRILVTGAGGSIGSEISRQVAACGPARLVLLDNDETHLHDVATSLKTPAVQVLADIRNEALIRLVFERHRPDVVFHAAAHKHVPLLETHPSEAAMTNVVGTRNVLDAARLSGVERFVFISTDKAVEPSSVMGASKRVGERLMRSMAPEDAHWCAVRFGNVLGSRGSVIPTFMRQIADGGPVTVTDERMTRYFMSIEEAVQLVLQATGLSAGGEIFVLDMGEPVRIVDLAERMIRLSGRRVGADVEIKITGVRPGEKLAEELFTMSEELLPTAHPSISQLCVDDMSDASLARDVARVEEIATGFHDDAVRALLFELATRRGSVELPLDRRP
jgi:FlaA1/EpsC-like NDP-sugar epimerase